MFLLCFHLSWDGSCFFKTIPLPYIASASRRLRKVLVDDAGTEFDGGITSWDEKILRSETVTQQPAFRVDGTKKKRLEPFGISETFVLSGQASKFWGSTIQLYTPPKKLHGELENHEIFQWDLLILLAPTTSGADDWARLATLQLLGGVNWLTHDMLGRPESTGVSLTMYALFCRKLVPLFLRATYLHQTYTSICVCHIYIYIFLTHPYWIVGVFVPVTVLTWMKSKWCAFLILHPFFVLMCHKDLFYYIFEP